MGIPEFIKSHSNSTISSVLFSSLKNSFISRFLRRDDEPKEILNPRSLRSYCFGRNSSSRGGALFRSDCRNSPFPGPGAAEHSKYSRMDRSRVPDISGCDLVSGAEDKGNKPGSITSIDLEWENEGKGQ